MKICPPRTRTLVLGIDPGPARPSALAARTVLAIDDATGAISVALPAKPMKVAALRAFLADDPLLSEPALRMVCLAAPLTPRPLEQKPWKARAVEIRLARGAFSTTERGPGMPWIATPRLWPLYEQAVPLLDALVARRFPLLTLPPENAFAELPRRCTAEVFPKASLAVLASRELVQDRPHSGQSFSQLDDWLFPQLFMASGISSPPFEACLRCLAPRLHLTPQTFQEAERIARLRRPSPRREPLRAFVAALQGILALVGAACIVGAAGESEGSVLLPATWHPDWETEWRDSRRSVSQVRRLPVRDSINLPAVNIANPEHAVLIAETFP